MGETFTRVPNWVLDSQEFTTCEMLVLLALCRFQNLEGCCYPSIQRLVEVSKIGRASIFKALKGLEEKGAITRDERRHGGHKTSNYYTVHKVHHVDVENSIVHHTDVATSTTRTGVVHHVDGNYIKEQEPREELKTNTKTCSGGSFLHLRENRARERKVTPLKELETWIKNMTEGENADD